MKKIKQLCLAGTLMISSLAMGADPLGLVKTTYQKVKESISSHLNPEHLDILVIPQDSLAEDYTFFLRRDLEFKATDPLNGTSYLYSRDYNSIPTDPIDIFQTDNDILERIIKKDIGSSAKNFGWNYARNLAQEEDWIYQTLRTVDKVDNIRKIEISPEQDNSFYGLGLQKPLKLKANPQFNSGIGASINADCGNFRSSFNYEDFLNGSISLKAIYGRSWVNGPYIQGWSFEAQYGINRQKDKNFDPRYPNIDPNGTTLMFNYIIGF